MKLNNIKSEGDIRHWIGEHIVHCNGRLQLEWIEPSKYGSSVGQPDVQFTYENIKIGLELKYLQKTRKGIKWQLRPAQRRYHHMTMKNGGKSAILAYVAPTKEMILVRGNNIPLRDYASDPDSGCKFDEIDIWIMNIFPVDSDNHTMIGIEKTLFHIDDFWKREKNDK